MLAKLQAFLPKSPKAFFTINAVSGFNLGFFMVHFILQILRMFLWLLAKGIVSFYYISQLKVNSKTTFKIKQRHYFRWCIIIMFLPSQAIYNKTNEYPQKRILFISEISTIQNNSI